MCTLQLCTHELRQETSACNINNYIYLYFASNLIHHNCHGIAVCESFVIYGEQALLYGFAIQLLNILSALVTCVVYIKDVLGST